MSQLNLVILASPDHTRLAKNSRLGLGTTRKRGNSLKFSKQSVLVTQGIEENGRAEKPKGDGGATQRLGTTGRCCHTLAGGTS